uniref:Protocadherin beta 14 n=1 Tax=Catagonus wagneri TaxID=51154 RepID=A0A8C3WDJ2_9CETA
YAAGEGALVPQQRQVLIFFVLLGLSQGGPESVRYSVAEEGEIGSFVASLVRDLGLEVEQLSSRGARVACDDNEKHLRLDLLTGDLLLNEKLDREELCGSVEPCVLHFQIVLENPLQFFRAELHIKDINDHSPTFLDKEILIKISESTTVGTAFLLESAQDLDVGSNSLQNYTVSPNSHFYVKNRDTDDGKIYPELVLHTPLDHEEEPEIRLTLLALDGGSPPRSGTTQVLIKVLDINDNAPEFPQRLYEVQVLEDTPIGSWIITVSAKDLDAGNYGKISYTFFHASEDIRKTFEINSISGEVHLRLHLDFEVTQSYTIIIQATDGGGLSKECSLLVKVIDINDNPPEVTMSSITKIIPENASETLVALFSVRDQDSGENGRIVCSIQDDIPFFLKPTFKNFFTIVSEKALDRESRAEYNITITATDMGTPRLQTQHNITVLVADVNDNAPAFTQASYTLRVRENNSPALHIGSVSATDLDAGIYGELSYSFSHVSRDIRKTFEIHPVSGEVRLKALVDFELIKSYTINIQATDGGGLSGKSTILVSVVDVNDNPPEIVITSLSSPVQENSSPNIVVAVFSLRDQDSGDNGRMACSVQDDLPFLLKPTFKNFYTLVTERPLDRESRAEYNITITATDMGTPRLQTQHNITVLVADVNDNAPAFTQASYTLRVRENNSPALAGAASAGGCSVPEGHLPGHLVDVGGTGTLSHSYQYEVCLAGGTGTSEFKFLKPIIPSFPPPGTEREESHTFLNGFEFN